MIVQSDILCCPHCNGKINITDTKWTCLNCYQEWSIDSDRIVRMLEDNYSFSADRKGMNKLLDELRNMSYEQLLSNVQRLEKDYRDFEYNYCLNPARADWTILGNFFNKIVVDLGCGYGSISIPLQRRAKFVIAVDATLERIKFLSIMAKMKNAKNVLPIHGDVTKLPLMPQSIDRVIMVGLLEYASGKFWYSDNLSPRLKQIAFLKYLHNLLSDDGEIWIGIENQLSPVHFLGRTSHGELPFTPLLPKYFANIVHKLIRKQSNETYLWTRSGYRRLLKQAGFKNIEFYYAFTHYQMPRFIASSDKNRIFSKYLDGLGANSIKLQIDLTLLKFLDKIKLAGLFSPSFFIKAEKGG